MLALSVRQPYAHAIITGKKLIEVRTWATDYRGDLIIHASSRDAMPGIPPHVPRMALIGVVELVDVRPMTADDIVLASLPRKYKWRDKVAWVLDNPRPLSRPLPMRGTLRLFDVHPNVKRAVRRLSSGTSKT